MNRSMRGRLMEVTACSALCCPTVLDCQTADLEDSQLGQEAGHFFQEAVGTLLLFAIQIFFFFIDLFFIGFWV